MHFRGSGAFVLRAHYGLAEGDAAVVGRDALMPQRPEAGGPQGGHGAFGQALVLETAARERHVLQAGAFATATMMSTSVR